LQHHEGRFKAFVNMHSRKDENFLLVLQMYNAHKQHRTQPAAYYNQSRKQLINTRVSFLVLLQDLCDSKLKVFLRHMLPAFTKGVHSWKPISYGSLKLSSTHQPRYRYLSLLHQNIDPSFRRGDGD